MREFLFVGIGGMFGSMCRYGAGSFISKYTFSSGFPWATFSVNILGCLLIGFLFGSIEKLGPNNLELKLLLVTGFLGGFTTFSAFGVETLHLLRTGMVPVAAVYAVGSVGLGVAMTYVGLKLA